MPQRKCRVNCVGDTQEELDAGSRKTAGNTPVS